MRKGQSRSRSGGLVVFFFSLLADVAPCGLAAQAFLASFGHQDTSRGKKTIEIANSFWLGLERLQLGKRAEGSASAIDGRQHTTPPAH